MSKNTRHLTPQQKDALLCEAHCKRQARLAEKHWVRSAPYFAKMLNEQLFAELDFANFSTWCESIGVSASHGYSLAQLAGLPEGVRDSLQGKQVNLGNLKLILPRLEEAIEQQDDDEVDELIDEASRLRWSDLRQEMNGDTPAFQPVPIDCPHCGYVIELSRAARVESFHPKKKGV